MNSDWILSLAALAALALLGGAAYLWRTPTERRRAILMAVAGVVVLLNVAVWSLPGPRAPGGAPVSTEAP